MLLFHLWRNIEGRLCGHPVSSWMTSSSWKKFFWHDLGRSFHIWCQNEAVIFKKIQNSRHVELAINCFTGSYTGSWIYQKDSHQYFRYFELLIDAPAQILTEIYKFDLLCDFVKSSMTSWVRETKLAQLDIPNSVPAKHCLCGTSPS